MIDPALMSKLVNQYRNSQNPTPQVDFQKVLSGVFKTALYPPCVSRDRFIQKYLIQEMRLHSGNKRIRKKKAKRVLQRIWRIQRLGTMMSEMVSRRIDYQSIARQIFSVQPMPESALAIYDKDPDVTSYVTGKSL